MTSPWEHPPLCVCPACSSRRETALRKRVEVLEAEVERLTREREDYREKRANEVDALRAALAGSQEALLREGMQHNRTREDFRLYAVRMGAEATRLCKRVEELEAEVERLNEQASGEGLHPTGCACRYCALAGKETP